MRTHHIAANEPAVCARDAEGVHQMRVGLRRLRAAIAVFSDFLDDAQTADIKAGLKWLTGELAPARDLDVYITGNLKPLEQIVPARGGMERLEHDLEAQRAAAFERAKKAVESAHYHALMLDMLGWIVDGHWARTNDELVKARRERRAADFAHEEITRRARKVRKRARKLAALDARRRHKLRIATKKLRYTIGFFESFFAGRKASKRLRRYVRELKALQNSLGALNDISVHWRLANRLVGKRGRRDRAFAVGLVSGNEESRVGPLRDAAVTAAARLTHRRRFWA